MSFLVSASVAGIYLWEFIAGKPHVSYPFVVDTISAIIAAATTIICLTMYMWVPKKAVFPISLFIYFLTVSIAASLIVQTGNLASPFIAAWMLISLFAGIFGLWASLPMFLLVGAFAGMQYITDGGISVESIIILCAGGLLPLIAGLIVWRRDSDNTDNTKGETPYHNVKDKLGEVTAKSEVVINAIGDGVVAIDSLGNIKLINPAAQDIVGWNSADAISLNYKSVLKLINHSEKELDSANDPIAQVLNLNQQVRTNDLGLETKSGKKILISLVVSPIGEVGSGVIAVFHDITKEKAEERQQAEFISTASHEMRTPVASIEGYVSLAMNPRTAQIDIRAREYLNKAHQSAQHLGHLFQDLLDVSKADDGRLSNNPKVVNIVALVQDTVQSFKPKATEKGLRLIFKPMPDDDNVKHIAPEYSVNLDNDHIREVIDNLVENAIKYTLAGDVIVDVTATDDHVVVSVKDSGIGISAEDMPHLFQKFYRIDNKDTREIGGTGLGLYLSRRLTEIMGGRIWAESTLGVGTTFFVDLPRVSSEQAQMITEQSALVAQENAVQTDQPALNQPQAPAKQVMDIIRPANAVPRGQALTPQQIAAYVAQQHALAQQNPKPVAIPPLPRDGRMQSFNIPSRGPQI